MQTGIQSQGSPKVKREMWERGRHQPYVAPVVLDVYERVGSGANTLIAYVMQPVAGAFLEDRSLHWLNKGYTVEWHDENRWFIATHETEPTVFYVLQETS